MRIILRQLGLVLFSLGYRYVYSPSAQLHNFSRCIYQFLHVLVWCSEKPVVTRTSTWKQQHHWLKLDRPHWGLRLTSATSKGNTLDVLIENLICMWSIAFRMTHLTGLSHHHPHWSCIGTSGEWRLIVECACFAPCRYLWRATTHMGKKIYAWLVDAQCFLRFKFS